MTKRVKIDNLWVHAKEGEKEKSGNKNIHREKRDN